MKIPCGSELARESGLSFNINVDWSAAFASKLAPTIELCSGWVSFPESGNAVTRRMSVGKTDAAKT